jgi:probable DNA repair protein
MKNKAIKMDSRLFDWARTGGLVLTVNDRLSRHLSQQFDHEQQDQGCSVWLRPDILSLSAWLSRCQSLLPGDPAFLNKSQLQRVWESIILSDMQKVGAHLLHVPQTARRALQAHQMLVRYAADFKASEAAEDHRAFLRWHKAWRSLASTEGWHDPVEMPWLLADAVIEESVSLPKKICFAVFDDMTPDLTRLCETLEHCGYQVEYWQPEPCRNSHQMRVSADDPVDEVSRCARWARSLISQNPAARIAVVAPQLDAYQALINRVFTAEIEPERLLESGEVPRIFNLSLGQSLDQEGVVHAALRLLRLGRQIEQTDLSWLLHTPYLYNSVAEFANRAKLDRELRRLRRFDWPAPRLFNTIKGLADKHALPATGVLKCIDSIVADLNKSSRQMPGFWAEHFTNLLHDLGWPGERGLSSREYQAVQRFRSVFADLASLDTVSKTIDRSEAVKILTRLTASVEFQAEGTDGPIQVLGELESAGLTFDYLWVIGLTDTAMPSTPSPNPFIPLPVQKRHKMKRSDAEREYQFADKVATRLFSAAPQVVVSWPIQDNASPQRPSPFIVEIPDGEPLLASTSDPARLMVSSRPPLDALIDNQAPPISSRKPFTGGTGIIKDQALCPFRAFVHHRLRADSLDSPDIGIDNMSRGTLAHTALELFWAKTGDQNSLLALDEQALTSSLDEAVKGALDRLERERRHDISPKQRRIEHTRLSRLVRQWLEVERRRQSFRVTAAEKGAIIRIGNLSIRTRIDRIDELADGTCAIIDYKTGIPDPTQWLEERVTEPQLPAYCLSMPANKVGAVMFAAVRGKQKECGFRGVARNIELWPGARLRKVDAILTEKGWEHFSDLYAHWQRALPALGDDFTNGVAVVDPVDPKLACQYCDLTSLCRVLEQGAGQQEPLDD